MHEFSVKFNGQSKKNFDLGPRGPYNQRNNFYLKLQNLPVCHGSLLYTIFFYIFSERTDIGIVE